MNGYDNEDDETMMIVHDVDHLIGAMTSVSPQHQHPEMPALLLLLLQGRQLSYTIV